jgi:transposase-like protein
MANRIGRCIVTLSAEQRQELEALQRRTSVAAGLVKRARAILLLADGVSVSATSRLVGMERRHLYKWIERFRHQGVAGLQDGKRSGRPPVFSPRGRGAPGQDRLRTAR